MSCLSHCCLIHGCKYTNTNCPVANGEQDQEFPCEYCNELGITTVEEVKLYDLGRLPMCPHCKHVLRVGENTQKFIT